MQFRSKRFISCLTIVLLAMAFFTTTASATGSKTTFKYTIKNDTNNGASSGACYNITISEAAIRFDRLLRGTDTHSTFLTFKGIQPGASATQSKTITPVEIWATVKGGNGISKKISLDRGDTTATITLTSQCQLRVN